ncbi:hypothetical protein PABG_12458 [Paracoccidioides brasiliensis Pb03]|nr:hypothetical protein PABG_12458 [Paracoccidioides brasiliensis Pb03]
MNTPKEKRSIIEPQDSSSPNDLSEFNTLGLDSNTATAKGSQALTLAQKPVSIFEEQLGTGAVGQVDLIIDVSTAARFRAEEILQTCLVGAFFSFIYCRAGGALI